MRCQPRSPVREKTRLLSSEVMGYQPNLEREEYSPPDKRRMTFVALLTAVAVVVVALIVYGLFVLSKGMVAVPSGQVRAEPTIRALADAAAQSSFSRAS